MSNLDTLIQNLCPNGVNKRYLSEVATYKDGAAHEHIMGENGNYIVTKVKFISSDGEYKMYCDKRLSPVEKDDVIMVMSDLPNGKSLAKCFLIDEDRKYTINQRVCALTPNKELLPKYLYYVLNRNKQLLKYDTGHTQTHLKKSYILKVQIPVPPMKIQEEVVQILDAFTEHIGLLNNELQARRQQFEWCQSKLLRFNTHITYAKLGSVCTLEKGKTAIQKATPGDYPLVVTAVERKSSDSYQFEKAAVCIPLVSSRGHGVASINQLFYEEGKFALGNILCAAIPRNENQLLTKYLYYYLNFKKDVAIVPLMKGGANVSVTVSDLNKVKVEYPEINRQKYIIDCLDSLSQMCDVLEEEIALRQSQYAYYLNKVLTKIDA